MLALHAADSGSVLTTAHDPLGPARSDSCTE